MTFVPNLNFFEFIPEDELIKLEMDRTYVPRTLLLDEVRAGENYEVVLTNFHGGAMVRYRPGDMIRITSLRNDKLGMDIPQMAFERRVDGLIDFNVIRLSEKTIWEALEKSGVAYEDWTAYKEPGQQVLNLLIELKNGYKEEEKTLAARVRKNLLQIDSEEFGQSAVHSDTIDMLGFDIRVQLLRPGTFADYSSEKQTTGADLAHLKPPHIQPSQETLTLLVAKPEKVAEAAETQSSDKVAAV